MDLELVYSENSLSLPLTSVEIYELLLYVLDYEHIECACSVSLSLLTNAEIAALNKEWRSVDAPTDVLSFECDNPREADLGSGPCELGDILLAPVYIEEQAKSFSTTFSDECRLMLVHAMLHLLGYDHEFEHDAELMQSRELEILSSLPSDGTITEHVLASHHEELS